MSIVPIESAITSEECILFSSDRLSAIRKHLNPADDSTSSAELKQLFQTYQAGDRSVADEINLRISQRKPNKASTKDLQLQWDLLRYDTLSDGMKSTLRQRVRNMLRPETNHVKPRERGVFNKVVDDTAKLPSRFKPVVTKQLLHEKLLPGTDLWRTFSKSTIGFLNTMELSPNQVRQFITSVGASQLAMLPNIVDLMSRFIQILKKPDRPAELWSHNRHTLLILRSMTLKQLLSLPNEVRREIKVTGLILERMKPVNFDPESPKSRMEYAQIVLAFAEENLKNPSNDLLKIDLLGSLVTDQWELDQTVDMKNFLKFLQLRQQCKYFRSGRYQPKKEYDILSSSDVVSKPRELISLSDGIINVILEALFNEKVEVLDTDSDIKSLRRVLRKEIYQWFENEARLFAGLDTDGSAWKYLTNYSNDVLGRRLPADTPYSSKLDLVRNPKAFAPHERVKLKLKVKNIKEVVVKVFKINLKTYYREKMDQIATDLKLEGLTAKVERTQQVDSRNAFHMQELAFDIPELDDTRGVFFVDLIANGLHARAMIRKGNIHLLSRLGAAGHVFTLISENREKLMNGKIFMDGHEFNADDEGSIYIPYSTSPKQQKVIVETSDYPDFCVLKEFRHQSESYSFSADFYLDREQIMDKRQASLLIRSSAKANGSICQLDICENVVVTISTTNTSGVSSTKTFDRVKLSDDEDTVLKFRVPMRCRQISVNLKGRIKNHSQNKWVDIYGSKDFVVNDLVLGDAIENAHLIAQPQGYVIAYCGRNGEALPNVETNVTVKHRLVQKPIRSQLMTDERGYIYLPVLQDCEWISAFGTSWGLAAPRSQSSSDNRIIAQAAEKVVIPYQIPKHIVDSPGLFNFDVTKGIRLVDNMCREDFTDKVTLENGWITVTGLGAGDYDLYMRDDDSASFSIQILEGTMVDDYMLGKKQFIQLSSVDNLRILGVEKKDNELLIEVPKEDLRLHVFATHMHPRFDAFDSLNLDTHEGRTTLDVSEPSSLYCPTRKISEEQRYIEERKRQKPMMGNMLQKPSFLMKPKASEEAATRTREAAVGESLRRMYESDSMARSAMMANQAYRSRGMNHRSQRQDEYIEFLNATSVALTNLKPELVDGKYIVKVPRESFAKDHTFCQLLLNDGVSLASEHISLSEENPEEKSDLEVPAPVYNYVDQRLNPGLDPEQNFTERKNIQLLNEDNKEYFVADYKASEVEFYDNAKDLFQLFKTLYSGSGLEEWSFLSKWNFLSEDEKLDKFDKYTCHELNFFIFMKDKDFFNSVVQPFIQSKLNKGLIDLYLLDDVKSLEIFTEMHNFSKLNHLEKILLADKMGELKPKFKEACLKYYQSAGETETIDPKELERLFSIVLSGKEMEEDFPIVGGGGFSMPTMAGPPMGLMMEMGGPPMFDYGPPMPGGAPPPMPGGAPPPMPKAAPPPPPMPMASSASMGMALPRSRAKKSARRKDMSMRKEMAKPQLYRAIDTTKIYEETFYYNYGYKTSTSQIVPMNKFWCDFGVWFLGDQNQGFLSENMAVPTGSLNECLFALAVFGLEFDSEGVNVAWEPNGISVKITAEKPVVVFSKEIQQTDTRPSSISIHQFYFDPNNPTTTVDGEQVDQFVTQFHPRQIYGCRAVLTNISSAPLINLEVLKQIPVGAIALNNKDSTETELIRINAYGTKIIEFKFYFPEVGTYRHFPIQVAKKNFVIGCGNAGELQVALPEQTKEVNVESWKDVAMNADPKTVLTYLENHNVYKMDKHGDLALIHWRLKDKNFWSSYVDILRKYNIYIPTVWGYAFMHDSDREIREYYSDSGRSFQNPKEFKSPLLQQDAFLLREYTHLEFFPLVNARAHQLGKKREILNDKLLEQYKKFIKLAMARSTSVETMLPKDKLAAIYYLLIQDRFNEAIEVFKLVSEEDGKDASEFCYDYLRGYLNFLDEDQSVAKKVVEKYKDQLLVPAKRKLIEDFSASLSELGDFVYEPSENIDLADRDREMDKKASREASLDFKVENREIKIEHFGLDKVTINYFKMDVELMFSTSPFSMSGSASGNFAFIQPTVSQVVDLADDGRVTMTSAELPKDLQFCNVYVEISGGTLLKSTTYFDSNLIVQLKRNFGQLQVINKQTKKPIKRAYVKVYANTNSGDEFYKDGYTDIRGRFDYVAISSNQLSRTKKFALLVCTEEGSVVLSAKPPKQ